AATGLVGDMHAQPIRMRDAASAGFTTATDFADWLVRVLNIPFREAHHVTGQVVKLAEGKRCDLSELSLEDMQSIEARITKDVFTVLTVEASAASRTSYGGTAPNNVRQQVQAARERFIKTRLG